MGRRFGQIAAPIVVLGVIVVLCVQHAHDVGQAIDAVPAGTLIAAVALHMLALVMRSEAWGLAGVEQHLVVVHLRLRPRRPHYRLAPARDVAELHGPVGELRADEPERLALLAVLGVAPLRAVAFGMGARGDLAAGGGSPAIAGRVVRRGGRRRRGRRLGTGGRHQDRVLVAPRVVRPCFERDLGNRVPRVAQRQVQRRPVGKAPAGQRAGSAEVAAPAWRPCAFVEQHLVLVDVLAPLLLRLADQGAVVGAQMPQPHAAVGTRERADGPQRVLLFGVGLAVVAMPPLRRTLRHRPSRRSSPPILGHEIPLLLASHWNIRAGCFQAHSHRARIERPRRRSSTAPQDHVRFPCAPPIVRRVGRESTGSRAMLKHLGGRYADLARWRSKPSVKPVFPGCAETENVSFPAPNGG